MTCSCALKQGGIRACAFYILGTAMRTGLPGFALGSLIQSHLTGQGKQAQVLSSVLKPYAGKNKIFTERLTWALY
eukprot:1143115-Pelagomonas_calceolata.AAC.3